MIIHPFEPVYDENSKILILGSFPSVKSREDNFFYGHPRNRFWKLLAALFAEEVPEDMSAKKDFLLRHGIALWDVVYSCDITGSADSTIKNVRPVDLRAVLERADIQRIFVNGSTAKKYYDRYLRDTLGREAFLLPSTSPANAAWSLEKLMKAWEIVKL